MHLAAARSLDQIIHFLHESLLSLQEKKILVGFDGFIDTIVKPVRKFSINDEHEYFDTIVEFGSFIGEHSNKSSSIQYEILQKKIGVNMPNFVNALDALSLPVTAIGMLSNEAGAVDPFFTGLGKKRYSYLAAGAATAFEFNDGKVLFSSVNVPGVQPDEKMFPRIESVFPEFCIALGHADLIAFLNWSELPFAQDLWDDVYIHGLSSVEIDKTRYVLFDLCDTGAKNHSEIEAVFSLIGKISQRRRTILSLNKNEAFDINKKIGGRHCSMAETAELLFRRFDIDELLIHQHTESIAVSAGGMLIEPCIFNKNPRISTGAGDHFNAAYGFATLAAMPVMEKLKFANAYSGAYIAEGASPGLEYFSKRLNNSGSVR